MLPTRSSRVGPAVPITLSNVDAPRRGLFESLLSVSPDAVIVVGPGGRIELASPAVTKLFGYDPHELTGETIEILLPEELRGRHGGHRASYESHPAARPMGSGLDLHGRRQDGTTFSVDVSLAPLEYDGSPMVVAFVRDATAQRRREDVLRFVNEISTQLLASRPTAAILTLTAGRARTLVKAASAWIVVPQRRGAGLVVAAADGEGAESLVGAQLSAEDSLSARTMIEAAALPIEDMASHAGVLDEARRLDLGPGVYLPMLAEDTAVGALVLGRAKGGAGFDDDEKQVLEVFASAASIVLSLGQTRQEVETLRLVSEQERIARDLHDTVIQRLFALGMSLQGLVRLSEGVVGERIGAAVDVIDQVIREIRETIFELYRPDTGGPDIRGQLRTVAAEAADQLGFEPRVGFRGPVEAAVTDELAPHLVAAAREALSNVARHAKATAVEVLLTADEDSVNLSVADDGIGIPEGPTAGHGRANLESRAKVFGGGLVVNRRRPAGTVLDWHVPTPGSSA